MFFDDRDRLHSSVRAITTRRPGDPVAELPRRALDETIFSETEVNQLELNASTASREQDDESAQIWVTRRASDLAIQCLTSLDARPTQP